MPIPDNFTDPYYGDITNAVIALVENAPRGPVGYEVREYEDDLGGEGSVAGLISRVALRPLFLVHVTAAQASEPDSVFTAYRERIQIEVLCCVSNPRSITEQKRSAMAAFGYVRRVLSGKSLRGEFFAPAPLVYDSWETVTNGVGLAVVSCNFFIDTFTTLDTDA